MDTCQWTISSGHKLCPWCFKCLLCFRAALRNVTSSVSGYLRAMLITKITENKIARKDTRYRGTKAPRANTIENCYNAEMVEWLGHVKRVDDSRSTKVAFTLHKLTGSESELV